MSLTASSLACAIALWSNIPLAQAKSLTFKVPKRTPPKVTSGAASRSGQQACVAQNQAPFRALVPKPTNYGLTTAQSPVLLVYIPKSSAQSLEVILKPADSAKPLYKTILPTPAPGILRLSLADPTMQAFKANQPYQWSVALVCESEFLIDRTTIEGWVERIEPTPELTQKLNRASAQDRPGIYAEAGIWYETLQSLDDLRQAQPGDAAIGENWTSLLKSVGLESPPSFLPVKLDWGDRATSAITHPASREGVAKRLNGRESP